MFYRLHFKTDVILNFKIGLHQKHQSHSFKKDWYSSSKEEGISVKWILY